MFDEVSFDHPTPLIAIYAIWILWWVSWHIAALWSAKTVNTGFSNGAPYIVMAIAGFILLLSFVPLRHHSLQWPLWSLTPEAGWAFVGFGVVAFAFMWWARIHLGRLWSGGIVTKEGHRVVDTGPYALVRHPIYAGLLLLAGATAAIKGDAMAVTGAVILTVAYVGKARLEERFLAAEMGAAYDAYRRRVPMIVPFFPA